MHLWKYIIMFSLYKSNIQFHPLLQGNSVVTSWLYSSQKSLALHNSQDTKLNKISKSNWWWHFLKAKYPQKNKGKKSSMNCSNPSCVVWNQNYCIACTCSCWKYSFIKTKKQGAPEWRIGQRHSVWSAGF